MKKEVSVSLPQNLRKTEVDLFSSNLYYTLQSLTVKKLSNVFITYTGYCLNHEGLIKECHHDYPHQFSRFLKEASEAYYDSKDHPEKLIELNNNKTYLMIHHPWFMYYHWVCESLLRVWMVKEEVKNMVLLLPAHYQYNNFVLSSLKPFKFKGIYFIPEGKNLMVRHVIMPQIKPIMEGYDALQMKEIRNFYQGFVRKQKAIQNNLGERLYVSRSKSARRKIMNEEEVINVLLKYNFTIIYNEDYSFLEQVAIYSNARYLISIHGSGLTNMIFMKENSVVFELYKQITNPNDWHSLIFWYMADAMGHEYYQQVCEPVNNNDDIFNANIVVNIDLMCNNLRMMFA
jgi:capsular polysaccharide biosynthesis protein